MAHSGKTITFATDLLPNEDEIYSLGASDKKWNIYGNNLSINSLSTFKLNTNIATGTQTNQVASSPYQSALWKFNLSLSATSFTTGDTIIIKTPGSGGSQGVFLSLDNGTTYRPISVSGTSKLTTHFATGVTLILTYDSAGQVNSLYGKVDANGTLSTTTGTNNVGGGCWRVLNNHDSNTNTLLRTYASATNLNVPLIGSSSANSTTAAWATYTGTYKDWYGVIPNDDTKRAKINLSTGHMTVPGGITADLNGSATSATNDSDGNAINTTYLPLSGGTMTGNIRRYYSAASTEPMITMLSNNQDILLWEAGHGSASAATTTSSHYKLMYKGTGSSDSNSNYLQLIAHNTSDLIAVQIDEVGNVSLPQMNKGSATKPIYLNNGVITEGTAIGASGYHADSYFVKAVTSTDNAIVRFDGTEGAIQNSTCTIDDNGAIHVGGDGIYFTGANNLVAAFKLTNTNTNIDMGWEWNSVGGAGAFFHSSSGSNPGMFGFFARTKSGNTTITTQLYGYPGTANDNGKLTWGGKRVVTATDNTQIGSSTQPVYISNTGLATAASAYAGGTAVTLNGTSKGATTASFYAPTTAGTAGQVLKSTAGEPEWQAEYQVEIIRLVT